MADFTSTIRMELKKIAELPDDEVDLAKAALLISRSDYPHLDEAFYLKQLDRLGLCLEERIVGLIDARSIAESMTRFLFVEEGFRGNIKDYYNPDNSFLNRVLDHKVGIPISLSLVYIEVGRRAGMNVQGMGLPGHFVVALYESMERILIDPFEGGKVLSEEECRRKLAVQSLGATPFTDRLIKPLRPARILARLLRNLKGIYRHMGDEMKTFQMMEWILALEPDSAPEYRERGMIYERLGAYDKAARDFMMYMYLVPEAEDVPMIEARMKAIKDETTRFH